ncbi:MAG: YeeE/YedE thiosulfate transporter family protein [Thiohalophilus sp.]|uniref:YeeE/YedE family protein n=1 Tax=Thiohalophilus sp. TaxID=3028392 RepID=UPI0028701AA4|nr:YeeE/YedE thiosulfate transporter family protein [Thiohalophilus sp.]MDR9435754.1 YeeE/YedE thiosulfate transporter family protein [Thiohalophilus sp.]
MEYWPWWIGALALGGVSLGYLLLIGKMLGVSGSWAKVVGWKEDRELARSAAQLEEADDGEIEDALLAATLAEFGAGAVDEKSSAETSAGDDTTTATSQTVSHTPWTAHLTFLLAMFIGGLIAALTSGQFEVELQLSDTHSRIFDGPMEVWLALLFGGMMVGFGAQMAGGCTSGHGLSGCARLIPASLLSTVVFMLSAIGLSLLMEAAI